MITRCPLCPGTNACIGPDGPSDARVLFVGEAPGHVENQKGVVFVGKTGDEVNRHYLPLAGLRRDAVCITNAIRCLPTSAGGKLDSKRIKDIQLLESCATQHLYPLIERGGFKAIVPLGAFACKAVCPEVNLDLHHGIPVETVWGIPAFPMYHPARGIHEPKKMLQIRTDWQRLRLFLKGTLRLPTDDYLTPDYQEATLADIQELSPSLPLAGDTESTRKGEPYCLTFSQEAGRGRLIKASRLDLLEAFQERLSHWSGPILFHNWLYDWTVTEKMALLFPYRRIVDTMAQIYQLGNLPQGLKAVAFRELGMVMQDFYDVVSPHSTAKVLDYYYKAQLVDWQRPDPEMVVDGKTGLWKLYKPQSMKTKLKRFFTDVSKNEEKDVFGMWDKWEPAQQQMEEECGPYPGLCISHVPFEEALYYSCRDADALIRLWPLLKRMRANVRHTSQEWWSDARH